MITDFGKFKVIKATPPERLRVGPGIVSELTKAMIALEPGEALALSTKGEDNHKSKQRQVVARMKAISKMYAGRAYETRTVKPGSKVDGGGSGTPVKEMTLGIYRVR